MINTGEAYVSVKERTVFVAYAQVGGDVRLIGVYDTQENADQAGIEAKRLLELVEDGSKITVRADETKYVTTDIKTGPYYPPGVRGPSEPQFPWGTFVINNSGLNPEEVEKALRLGVDDATLS